MPRHVHVCVRGAGGGWCVQACMCVGLGVYMYDPGSGESGVCVTLQWRVVFA